jgi:hypothetical protein
MIILTESIAWWRYAWSRFRSNWEDMQIEKRLCEAHGRVDRCYRKRESGIIGKAEEDGRPRG